MSLRKLIFILIAGGLFGGGLAISGMTDPARVIGFLDAFGKWDPALGAGSWQLPLQNLERSIAVL